MTKTNEALKEELKLILNDIYLTKTKDLEEHYKNTSFSSFMWGILIGIITSYVGFWPFLTGATFGFFISKKDPSLIENIYTKANILMSIGYTTLTKHTTKI